jgi:hypothetical protein
MSRPKSIISKSELAAVLGLSKGRVTQLITKGLPVRPNGQVNRDEAVKWYGESIRQAFVKPGPRRPRAEASPVAKPGNAPTEEPAYSAMPRFAAWRYALETLIAESAKVPHLLAKAGIRDPVVLSIASEVFIDLVFHLGDVLTDGAYDWAADDDRSPTPTTDLAALAKKYGFQYDPEAVRTGAEAMLERFDAVLFETPPAGAE